MTDHAEILIMTSEQKVAVQVQEVLDPLSDILGKIAVCGDYSQLRRMMEMHEPQLVLVDVDPNPDQGLNELESISERYPATRFIVMASGSLNGYMLKAMQIGVRHVQFKSTLDSELGDVMRRLVPHKTGNAKRGNVVSLLSAGGGCGATTLALNLSNQMFEQGNDRVMLVDLDVAYGSLGTYLDLQSAYGVSDILSAGSRLDEELIESTAVHFHDRFHVLLSPATTQGPLAAPLPTEHIDLVLGTCRRLYRHTIVDAPRFEMDASARLARASDLVLIVFQLNVKDLRMAQVIRRSLSSRGVEPGRILMVMNRYRARKALLSIDDVKSSLGDVPLMCVHNDYRNAVRCVNLGRTLNQVAPRSSLTRDVDHLATRIQSMSQLASVEQHEVKS